MSDMFSDIPKKKKNINKLRDINDTQLFFFFDSYFYFVIFGFLRAKTAASRDRWRFFLIKE